MSEGLFGSLRREIDRMRYRGFLEAVMAAAALVALSDQDYGLAEKYKAEEILSEIPLFDVFELSEAMELLDQDVHDLRTDTAAATERLERRIAAVADDADHARTLLRAAWAIVTADGTVTPAERTEFARLSELVACDPAELGLPGFVAET